MAFKLVILASMLALVACLPTEPYTAKDPNTMEEPSIVDYTEKKDAYSEKKDAYSEKKAYTAKTEYKPSYTSEYKKSEVKAFRADTSYAVTEKYAKTAYVDKTVKSKAETTTTVVHPEPPVIPVIINPLDPVIINPLNPFDPLASAYNPYAPYLNPYGYIYQNTQIRDISPLNSANPLSPLNPDSPYYNGAFAAYFYRSAANPAPYTAHPAYTAIPEVPLTPPAVPSVRHYY